MFPAASVTVNVTVYKPSIVKSTLDAVVPFTVMLLLTMPQLSVEVLKVALDADRETDAPSKLRVIALATATGSMLSITDTTAEVVDPYWVPSDARTYTVLSPTLSQSNDSEFAQVNASWESSMVGDEAQLSVAEAERSPGAMVAEPSGPSARLALDAVTAGPVVSSMVRVTATLPPSLVPSLARTYTVLLPRLSHPKVREELQSTLFLDKVNDTEAEQLSVADAAKTDGIKV